MKLSERTYYPMRLQKLLANKKYDQALRELEEAITDDGSMFATDPAILESRRALWLIRIDILRSIGRHSEALAWICLECELNPENVVAQALKNQLKESLSLSGRTSFDTHLTAKSKQSDLWEGVAGMRQLKSVLETDVVLPLLEKGIYDLYKISVPNGVLFYGPPGCGKTYIAKKLSIRLNRKFFASKPSDFASIYVHGTQEKIRKQFDHVAAHGPAVFLLDEMDALIPNRNNANLSHDFSSEVNEFLVQLDRAASKNILVIGATNHLDKIDEAAIRAGRFDKKIYVGPPDYEARMEALKQYMKERPQDFIDWELIAENTAEKTYADLKLLVDDVAKAALKTKESIGMKQFYEKLKL